MIPLGTYITLFDIKASLVEGRNSFPSHGRTMQYFPLTALLFESVEIVQLTLKRTTTKQPTSRYKCSRFAAMFGT